MALRTIDLSGRYVIAAVDANSITLTSPELINPNWYYNDLTGVGSTGYAQNIAMIKGSVGAGVNLAGTYTVAAVAPSQLTLVDPELVNGDWDLLPLFPDSKTRPLSSYVAKSGGNLIGPIIVEGADTILLVANFVALGGLFKDNGEKQTAFPITVELEATPVDGGDNPIGPAQIFQTTIPGNDKGRDMRAATLVCELNTPGRQSVTARRTTDADYAFEGTVVDEVKWKDLYGMSSVELADFGNVTTVHARTLATEGALSVKDRELNMLVTRRVPTRIAGEDFTAPVGTNYAADILTAVCLDPYIGARVMDELDLDSIYGAFAEAVAYFGNSEAAEFSFTFDDDNLSFQETAQIIASAAFSTAYRQGSTVRVQFEGAESDSSLLFNHRNKLPASETRTTRFGNLDNHDGVEFEYAAPEDDAPVTVYIPTDRSATNARVVKGQGVRGHLQAYWHAWRAWNKIKYQNQTTEFSALQEAALVIRNERVLVADNTAATTLDGEVVDQVGLELVLSQRAPIGGAGHTIFLQLPDGSVEAIPVTAGADDYRVVLGRAPRLALAIGDDLYAPAGYQIVHDEQPRTNAFLISEKEPEDAFTYTLRAVNYSPLYYANDQLLVWLDFESGYADASPFLIDGSAVGGSVIVDDPTRGRVHQGAASIDVVNLAPMEAPPSYTKLFWARRDDVMGSGSVLSSTAEHERVQFINEGVQASHGPDVLVGAWPGVAGEWHHVAVTYEADSGVMTVFVDGEKESSGVRPQRVLGQLYAVGYNGGNGLSGAVDDLRLLTRALAADEVRAIYRATRL